MSTKINVTFKGVPYILIQGKGQKGKEGALRKPELINKFALSDFYSRKDGSVVDNTKKVGTHDDIKVSPHEKNNRLA